MSSEPNNEFDPNKFAAEIVVQGVEATLSRVGNASTSAWLRRLYQKVTDAYAPFLEKTYQRVSTIRTFLKPTESIDLLTAYVPVNLDLDPEDIAADELLERVHLGQSFVISGLAGRGKSVLMRYLAVSMYHSPRGKLPLFLELRSLNALTSKDLLPFLHAQYNVGSKIQYEDFLAALQEGYFVILLDGFDEIAPSDRENIAAQILEITEENPNCSVIVSGRYDDRFFSWERFSVTQLLPMNFEQTTSLIEKAEYDEEVKRNFLRRLTTAFFSKHESFLNTPLLAIMLMRTFEEYAEIPHSVHEFYRNAFDTLVRRHDAMKSQFLRTTHSGCTAEEFKRIFSSFCVLTYSKSAFSFHRDEAIKFVDLALTQQEIDADSVQVLDDLIESVCLLHEEGFEISFVHRSFQEYFCALFVASAPSGFVERYLENANVRVHDDVLPMLIGMNRDRVEDEWASDFVDGVLGKYPRKDKTRHVRFMVDRMPKWGVECASVSRFIIIIDRTKLDRCYQILGRFYPEKFRGNSDRKRMSDEDYEAWVDGYTNQLILLEKQGVKELQGFQEETVKNWKEDESKIFSFTVDERFGEFFEAVFESDLTESLKGLEAVQRAQRSRKKSGVNFIENLFS